MCWQGRDEYDGGVLVAYESPHRFWLLCLLAIALRIKTPLPSASPLFLKGRKACRKVLSFAQIELSFPLSHRLSCRPERRHLVAVGGCWQARHEHDGGVLVAYESPHRFWLLCLLAIALRIKTPLPSASPLFLKGRKACRKVLSFAQIELSFPLSHRLSCRPERRHLVAVGGCWQARHEHDGGVLVAYESPHRFWLLCLLAIALRIKTPLPSASPLFLKGRKACRKVLSFAQIGFL